MERLPKKYFGSISDYVKTYYTGWGVTSFADKAYNAVKTVTKDFTRTDPVYVRVGEDGEPEIHYTMTQANASRFFEGVVFDTPTHLFIHNGQIITKMYPNAFASMGNVHIVIDSLRNCSEMTQSFPYGSKDWTLKIGEMPSVSVSMQNAFMYNTGIREIPSIDFSNVRNLKGFVTGCTNLTAIHCYGMKASFALNDRVPLIAHDAILEVFNNLGTVDKTAGITLTLGSAKLALMSDAEKAIATEKGWTLA